MNGFKRCPNGHFYQESLSECPYCQNSNGNLKDSKTVNIDLDTAGPTQVQPTPGNPAPTSSKTQVMGDLGTDAPTIPVSPSNPVVKNPAFFKAFPDIQA